MASSMSAALREMFIAHAIRIDDDSIHLVEKKNGDDATQTCLRSLFTTHLLFLFIDASGTMLSFCLKGKNFGLMVCNNLMMKIDTFE